jgi:hypothetical protein
MTSILPNYKMAATPPLPDRSNAVESTAPVTYPPITRILSPFGLDTEATHQLMHRTGAILAGGAVMNLFYNQSDETDHLDEPPPPAVPIHPDSDLDFWVSDPTPDRSHARRVYYDLICRQWDSFLEDAGYESYCPLGNGDYDETPGSDRSVFQTDCCTNIRIRYYQRPTATTHKRIQLIFYDSSPTDPQPASTLVRHFDLTICQAMLYASRTNDIWIATAEYATHIDSRIIRRRNPEEPPSERTQARIAKYLSRYPDLTYDGPEFLGLSSG